MKKYIPKIRILKDMVYIMWNNQEYIFPKDQCVNIIIWFILAVLVLYTNIALAYRDAQITKKNNELLQQIQQEIEEEVYLAKETTSTVKEEILVEEIILTKEEEFNQKVLELPKDKKQWFINYKELLENYSEDFAAPESIYDVFTEDEIYLMQRMIETECYGCDFDSKTHVASVLFNRLATDSGFSDNVYEVIKPGQFCYWRKVISEDTILALEYAYMIEDTSQGALYFNNFGDNPPEVWNGKNYIFTDECYHSFY